MNYLENSKKFAVVLNRKHPLPQLLNGACHATAGLSGALIRKEAEYLNYSNDAEKFVAVISLYPFIVLESKNSGQLATLRRAAAEAGIPHNVFVTAMIGRSALDQMENTKAAIGEHLDYIAVVLFGETVSVDPLIRKFSLLKDPAQAVGC